MSNLDKQYVYKYVNTSGDVVYIGITNNLPNRIYQHQSDKLQEVKNPTIYYFPVEHRADAELLETYLISYYRTGNKYNVSKTKKGDVSFFDNCADLPWVKYEGEVDASLKPFLMSSIAKIVEVEKEVQVIKHVHHHRDSIDGIIKQIHQEQDEIIQMINENIQFETEMIKNLELLLEQQPHSAIEQGKRLHQKRFEIIKQIDSNYPPILISGEEFNSLLADLKNVNREIETFESSLREREETE